MTKIIAEIGLAHEGSLGQAMNYIELASSLGCDAVKFQHHTEGESTAYHGFRDEMPEDVDRNAYWKRTGFTVSEWSTLVSHARSVRLDIGVSVFTVEGFQQIAHLGWDFFKLPSGEWENADMIAKMVTKGKRIYYSNGMMLGFMPVDTPVPFGMFYVMDCDSSYPGKLSDVVIHADHCLSDHSGTPWPAMLAVALGCTAVEVHLCMSKRQFGPDTESSVDPDQMKQIVLFRNAIHKMQAGPGESQKRLRKERYAEYKKCKSRFQH